MSRGAAPTARRSAAAKARSRVPVVPGSWLADGVLLAVLSEDAAENGGAPKQTAAVRGRGRVISYAGADLYGSESRGRAVVGVLDTAEAGLRARPKVRAELATGKGRRLELEVAIADLPVLLRQTFAPLDASTRNEIVEAIGAAVGAEVSSRLELSKSLFASREALRERLPRCQVHG